MRYSHHLFFDLDPLTIAYVSDSLETILSYLSTRVVNVIANGDHLEHLYYLLEFLAAWDKRPQSLTLIAQQWCSAISSAVQQLGRRKVLIIQPRQQQENLESNGEIQFQQQDPTGEIQLYPSGLGLQLRLRQQDPAHGEGPRSLFSIVEREFSHVGPGCDLVCSGAISHHTPSHLAYTHLLSITMEIGFRLATPQSTWPAPHLDWPSHTWIFETAFSSTDDDVVADAVCMWSASDHAPPGSFVHFFSTRARRAKLFSPRLRQMGICAIECIWRGELKASVSETVDLLNCLNANVDDLVEKSVWVELLVEVIRSPIGLKRLSPIYWDLLDKLMTGGNLPRIHMSCDVDVMGILEMIEDWKKLEVWTLVVWESLPWCGDINELPATPDPESTEDLAGPADYTKSMEETKPTDDHPMPTDGIKPMEETMPVEDTVVSMDGTEPMEETESAKEPEPAEDTWHKAMEEIDRLTLELLWQRPSALQRLERHLQFCWANEDILQNILNKAQPHSTRRYVSIPT